MIAYWIAPWLGIVLVDRYLRRGTEIASLVAENRKYSNIAGPISIVVGIVVSILLFSNQSFYVGLLVTASPAIGDLTAPAGFIIAAVLYLVLFKAFKPALGGPLTAEHEALVGPDDLAKVLS